MILQQIIKKFFCSRAYQKVIIYYRSTKDKKVLQLKKLEYPCHSRKLKKLEYPCHSRELKKLEYPCHSRELKKTARLTA